MQQKTTNFTGKKCLLNQNFDLTFWEGNAVQQLIIFIF